MSEVIPVNIRVDGELFAVIEDGLITECHHLRSHGDAVTREDGTDRERTIPAEVCDLCDAWYDRGSEEWIE